MANPWLMKSLFCFHFFCIFIQNIIRFNLIIKPMKKIFFLLLITLAVVSCSKKSDSTSSPEFTNKLTLGTGLNPSNLFQLTGEGTSFTTSNTIYFRLESADDMAGSAVRLKIDQQDGTSIFSRDYPSPSSYGNIFLSNFTLPRAGSYVATGILVTGLKTVASINFTVTK